MPLTVARLVQIFPQARPRAGQFVAPLNAAMLAYGITTPARQAAFLGQIGHESAGLSRLVESFAYRSALRLQEQFRRAFANFADACAVFDQGAQAIANRVYAGRNGNGDEASGDGWRYRGRGLIQITGRANYAAAGAALGLDLLSRPELLEQAEHACHASAWWWQAHGCNALADAGDARALTRRINGGLNGLDERIALMARAATLLRAA